MPSRKQSAPKPDETLSDGVRELDGAEELDVAGERKDDEGRQNRPWPASTVEERPIGRLVPYERNTRVHTEVQIQRIMESISRWGFTIPLLVDESNMVIAGHGRLEAAQRLGITALPVMVARGWTDAEKRAYSIADNRLTDLSTFDNSLLRAELSDLEELGFDLAAVGFDDPALEKLFKDDDPDVAILELPTTPTEDRFWITVQGPIEQQADALRAMRDLMDAFPGVEVHIGAIERN